MSGHFPNSVATPDQQQRINNNDLKQKEMVIQVLSDSKPLNDYEIWQECIRRKYINTMTPLTSIRRARSNLRKAGKIEDSGVVRDGGYGTDTICWKLKPQQAEQVDAFGPPSQPAGVQGD